MSEVLAGKARELNPEPHTAEESWRGGMCLGPENQESRDKQSF